jgi:hypothetical protein
LLQKRVFFYFSATGEGYVFDFQCRRRAGLLQNVAICCGIHVFVADNTGVVTSNIYTTKLQ